MEEFYEVTEQPLSTLVKRVDKLEEQLASIESVNPDYKENDPTSKSYIRNRLFYEEGEPARTYTPEAYDVYTEKMLVWAGLATPEVIQESQFKDYIITIELKGGINGEVIGTKTYPLSRLIKRYYSKDGVRVGTRCYISVGEYEYDEAVVHIIYDYEGYNAVVKDTQSPQFTSNGVYLCKSEYDTFSENVNYTNYTTVKSITKISTLKVHKLDKKFLDYSGVVEKAKAKDSVYATTSQGVTQMLEYATSPADGDNKRSLVLRNMRGGITIEDKYITEDDDAVNKKYVDDKYVPKSCIVLKASDDGGLTINIENQSTSEQGELYFDTERAGDVKLHNIATPTQDKDAANKKYVDDKVKGNSVDEIKYISTWSGEELSLLKLHKDGVIWNDEFLIESAESDMASGTIYQKIPLVAGENVTFEVDEENKVVKINAEGGSSDEIITTTGTGLNYLATVPSITELKQGVSFLMKAHVSNTSGSATLNVNNLGAANIYRRATDGSVTFHITKRGFLATNSVYRVFYDGVNWILLDYAKPLATDLYGEVPVKNGGVPTTSADNAGMVLTTNDEGIPEWQTPSASGGGTSEAIINVIELPTENINTNVLYSAPTGSLVFNRAIEPQHNVYCVDGLPSSGEPAIDASMTTITAYYNTQDGVAYGYVDSILSSALSVPVGWYPANTLFSAMGRNYGGVVTSIDNASLDNTYYVLIEETLNHYKDGKWLKYSSAEFIATRIAYVFSPTLTSLNDSVREHTSKISAIESSLGDIETALNSIISIQTSYIGGTT